MANMHHHQIQKALTSRNAFTSNRHTYIYSLSIFIEVEYILYGKKNACSISHGTCIAFSPITPTETKDQFQPSVNYDIS